MNFAQNARERFTTTTDLHVKKEIIFNLGSNFILFNRIVTLDIDSPLKLVEKIAPEVKKVNNRPELSDNIDSKDEMALAYASNPIMGQLLDSFLNVSIDFKFNINNIHALLNSGNSLNFKV